MNTITSCVIFSKVHAFIPNELVNTDYAVGIVQVEGGVKRFISGSFSVQFFNSVVRMYSMREKKVCCEQL